jgi:hypothetical protein
MITPRQIAVLDFIADYIGKNRCAPSLHEIALGVGLRSLATVHKHLQGLHAGGYIKRGWGRRDIKVLKHPDKAKCPMCHQPRKKLSALTGLTDLQHRVTAWATRCFGRDHVFNQRVRALRLLEEAAEFAQSVDAPIEKCHALVDYVYSRPPGKPEQELGGVGVVLLTCASATGVMLDDGIEAKPPEHFTQRNQAKCDAGFGAAHG